MTKLDSAGPELRAVGGACTAGQARNIALASQLQEVHRAVAALGPRLPPPAARALACVALPQGLSNY